MSSSAFDVVNPPMESLVLDFGRRPSSPPSRGRFRPNKRMPGVDTANISFVPQKNRAYTPSSIMCNRLSASTDRALPSLLRHRPGCPRPEEGRSLAHLVGSLLPAFCETSFRFLEYLRLFDVQRGNGESEGRLLSRFGLSPSPAPSRSATFLHNHPMDIPCVCAIAGR